MRLRTPLAVTVVGALLVGGAATGTTYAAWRDQAVLAGSQVSSGAMSHTVQSGGSSQLGALSLTAGAGAAGTVQATVRDTSSDRAKNLRQDVRLAGVQLTGATNGLSLAHLRLAVTAKPAGSCSTAVPPSSAAGYSTTPLGRTAPAAPDQTYDLCVAVAAVSGAPAATGSLQLTFAGEQVRPGGSGAGWRASSSASVSLTVAPAGPGAPTLTCRTSVTSPAGAILDWSATGATYKLRRASAAAGPYADVALTPSTARTYTAVHGQGESRYYQVVAVAANGAESAPSATALVSRSGNSSNYSCQVLP